LGWRGVTEDAKDLIRCCLDRNIYGRISAGEILEHPFIEKFAMTNDDIALKPIIEVDEPNEEVQDEAKVVEEFEKMKLPTEILEGNDDTGYHPYEYHSESEMAYSPPRSQPIPIRTLPTMNQVIAQPRIQVAMQNVHVPTMLVPPQQLATMVPPNAYQPYHPPPIGHAIGPRGIPMPNPTNNINPFYSGPVIPR
jgi:serine/threonine protein kinase